jgi:hypothetical protein
MTTPAPSPSMRLLPDGTVLHDYGEGSCFSCGGTVTATHDNATGCETALCTHGGVVEDTVFINDAGDPLQGFMRHGERSAYPLPDPYDFLNSDDIPY